MALKEWRLPAGNFLKFPFRLGERDRATGKRPVQMCNRQAHVRDQIEMVLFTAPGERVFRPEFGAGARHLLFQPNGTALAEVTEKRIHGALVEALRGEVDPQSLSIEVEAQHERLQITIRYELAAIHQSVEDVFEIGGSPDG